jgi:hypothetical protein
MNAPRASLAPSGRWVIAGVAAIMVGLAIWATTFVLVPAGLTMIVVGVVRWASARRRT